MASVSGFLRMPSCLRAFLPSFSRSVLRATAFATVATMMSLSAAAQTAHATDSVNDFGSVNVGTAATELTVSFTLDSAGTLGTPVVLTQGAAGKDFTLGTGSTCTGAQSGTCTVQVAFTPQFAGGRYGAAEITDAGGHVIATAFIQGSGYGSQVAFSPGVYTTIAGDGVNGYGGDGTPANAPGTHVTPNASVVDGADNVYIADTNNNVIRKIDGGTGIISTYAGVHTGSAYAGDGVLATDASVRFFGPSGLAVDGAGNLYIADQGNCVIRKVAADTQILTTVAGSHNCGYSADGVATSVDLNIPYAVAVDGAGNLYIADSGNSLIRVVNAVSGILTTIAGTPGSADYSGDNVPALGSDLNSPQAVALDGAGNIYIADTNNYRLRKIDAVSGTITTVAGDGNPGTAGDGGPATSAEFRVLLSLAVNAAGDIYLIDQNDVRKISALTGNISYPGYPGTSVTLNGAGDLYITDGADYVVNSVTAAAAPMAFADTAQGHIDGPQTATISNIGNRDLRITTPVSGLNPSLSANFTYDGVSSTCPQLSTSTAPYILVPGDSCTVLISFTPASNAGVTSGALTFTDSSHSPASPQSIALSGNSVPTPHLAFDASLLANYNVGDSAGAALTVNEDDASDALMTGAADKIRLNVSGPNSFSTTYLVTAVSGVATFDTSADTFPYPGTYTFTAISTTNSAIYEAVATVNVGATATASADTNVGVTSATQSATIIFHSSFTLGSIQVVTQGVSNSDYKEVIAGTTCAGSYNAGDSCVVKYTFTPGGPGVRPGAIIIYDNAATPNVVATQYLSGIGNAPLLSYPPSFTTVAYGASSEGSPNSVASDVAGNLLIADSSDNVVKRVSAAGVITTVSTSPYTLSMPSTVAIDGAGNIYINDAGNTRIIRVTSAGVASIFTPAISGLNNIADIKIDSAGTLYIVDPTGNRVLKTLPSGVTTVLDTGSITLNDPRGVAVDPSGNIYIADSDNAEIVEIDTTGTASVMSIGGTSFYQPNAIVADAAGDLYISDYGHSHSVYKMLSATGTAIRVQTTAGTAISLAIDGSSNLYIVDNNSNTVLKGDSVDAPGMNGVPAMDFGEVSAGQYNDLTLVLSNTGNQDLEADSAAPTPATYTLSGGSCGAIPAGYECDIDVVFAPVTGTFAGTTTPGSFLISNDSLNGTNNTSVGLTAVALEAPVATSIEVDQQATTAPAGATVPVQAFVVDQYDNLVGTDTPALSASTTDAAAQVTSYDSTFGFPLSSFLGGITFHTVGTQTVTYSAPGLTSATATTIVTAAPSFTVTTLTDPAVGNDANCTDQSLGGASADASCSLRDAIAVANDTTTSDYAGVANITFAPSLASQYPATMTLTGGEMDINSNVTITGPGSANLTIDANYTSAIFETGAPFAFGGASDSFSLSGVTLLHADGTNTNNDAAIDGAPGTATLTDVIIQGSTEGAGAGFGFAVALTVSNSQFIGNNSPFPGGGLYVPERSTVHISNSTFDSNTVAGYYGGGLMIDEDSTATITGSTFVGNTAPVGGGLYVGHGGTITVSHDIFNANHANDSGSGFGSAIALDSSDHHRTNATIDSAYIHDNTTDNSGTIAVSDIATVTIRNSSIYSNTVASQGSAILMAPGTLYVQQTTIAGNTGTDDTVLNSGAAATFTNVTISGNTATGTNGGIANDDTVPDVGTIVLNNSIVSGNTDPTNTDCYNCGTQDAHNLIGGAPMLSPLANYGGASDNFTMIALPGSPALGTGSIALAVDGNGNAFSNDQRGIGFARLTTYTANTVDLGAAQAHYQMFFSSSPHAVAVNTNDGFTVHIEESGVLMPVAGTPIALTLNGPGVLTPTSINTNSSGTASGSVKVDAPGTGDTLTATTGSSPVVLSATSASFDIGSTGTTPTALAFGIPPPATVAYGGNANFVAVEEMDSSGIAVISATDTITLTVTYPDSTTHQYVDTTGGGYAVFDLSGAALVLPGTYTYTASGSHSSVALTPPTPFVETVSAPVTSNYIFPNATLPQGGTSTVVTATLVFSSSFTPHTLTASTLGAAGSGFTVITGSGAGTCVLDQAYSPGDSCTVNITFTPTGPGLVTGVLSAVNASSVTGATANLASLRYR